jgi:hypothetical protein
MTKRVVLSLYRLANTTGIILLSPPLSTQQRKLLELLYVSTIVNISILTLLQIFHKSR